MTASIYLHLSLLAVISVLLVTLLWALEREETPAWTARKRRRVMRERYDVNPALRRR